MFCPESEEWKHRIQCLELPYSRCGECPRFAHRLKLLRHMGSVPVRCPVMEGRADQTVHDSYAAQGVPGTVTAGTCRVVRPFGHCPSCPNSSR